MTASYTRTHIRCLNNWTLRSYLTIMMFISCPTIAEGQKPDSSVPSAIIAVLAVLLLLTVIVITTSQRFSWYGKKKKSKHDDMIVRDRNVHNLNPSPYSCIPAPDNCKEDFEQQACVDSENTRGCVDQLTRVRTIMRNRLLIRWPMRDVRCDKARDLSGQIHATSWETFYASTHLTTSLSYNGRRLDTCSVDVWDKRIRWTKNWNLSRPIWDKCLKIYE